MTEQEKQSQLNKENEIIHKIKAGMTRRRFMAGTAGVSVLASGVGLLSPSKASASPWMLPSESVETPNSHQRKTLEALADTILPNSDGDVGGIESGAYTTMADPYYGLNPYISEMVSDIDDSAYWLHRGWWWGVPNDFKDRSLSDRTEILNERLSLSLYADAYSAAIMLTKFSFFGALQNNVGTDYIGFPGPVSGHGPNGL